MGDGFDTDDTSLGGAAGDYVAGTLRRAGDLGERFGRQFVSGVTAIGQSSYDIGVRFPHWLSSKVGGYEEFYEDYTPGAKKMSAMGPRWAPPPQNAAEGLVDIFAMGLSGPAATGMPLYALASRYNPQAASKFARLVLEPFRQQPRLALAAEAGIEAGAEFGSQAAEKYFPGNPVAQILMSLGGGLEGGSPFTSRLNRKLDVWEPLPLEGRHFSGRESTDMEAGATSARGELDELDEGIEPWLKAQGDEGLRPKEIRGIQFLKSPPDVKRMLHVNELEYQSQAKRHTTDYENQQMADALGITPDEVVNGKYASLGGRHDAMVLDAPHMQAAMDILQGSTFEVIDAVKAHKLAPTQQTRGDVLQALDRNRMIQMSVSNSSSEMGRSFRVLQGARGARQSAEALNKIIDQAGGTKNVDALVDMLDGLDMNELNRRARLQELRPKWQEKALEYWINWGLLSGPQTHLINISGNAAFAAADQFLLRPAAALRGFAHGDPDRIRMAELLAEIHGATTAVPLALRNFGRAVRTGDEGFAFRTNKLTEGGKDPRTARRFGPDKADQAGEVISTGQHIEGQLEGIGSTLRSGRAGWLRSAPGRFLGGMDEFFKTIAMEQSLSGSAARRAFHEGVDADGWQKYVARKTRDPDHQSLSRAMDHAKTMTFTTNPGKVGRNMQMAINSSPYMKFVVPFFRTPLNLAKENLHLMPGVTPKMRNMVKAGGRQQDLAVAHWYMGTALMAWAAGQAEEGKLFGSGAPRPGARAQDYAEGRKPNSILIGTRDDGYYMNVSRMQPYGSVMALTASVYNASKRGDITDEEGGSLAEYVIGAFAEHLGSQTALQGSSQFFGVYLDAQRNWSQYSEKMAGSVVPAAGGQAARAIDPVLRDTRGFSTHDQNFFERLYTEFSPALINRVPGLRHNLPPVHDLLGREERTGSEIGGAFQRWVNPFYASTAKTTPITKMMRQVSADVAKPARKVKVPDRYFDPEIRRRFPLVTGLYKEMNAFEYSDYSKMAGMIANAELHENFGRLMTLDPRRRRKKIREIFQDSRETAKDSIFRKWQAEGILDPAVLRKHEAEKKRLEATQ